MQKTLNKILSEIIFLLFCSIPFLQGTTVKVSNKTKRDFFVKVVLENKEHTSLRLTKVEPKGTINFNDYTAKELTDENKALKNTKIYYIDILSYKAEYDQGKRNENEDGSLIRLGNEYLEPHTKDNLLYIDINGPEDIVVSKDKELKDK